MMSDQQSPLLIIGASARAAACSALRAGLQPWCADLFADLDLQTRCPVQRLKRNYPRVFAEVIASDLVGPWMYTGGLENWPTLIEAWQRQRQLWGAHGDCLDWARDPMRVARILRDEGLPTPESRTQPPQDDPRRWLVKLRRSAGGDGVREWLVDEDAPSVAGVYWQEHIDGQLAAALYAGVDGAVQLLGLTRQLVGVPWLHARAFQYCGSIGPLQPPPKLQHELAALGNALGQRCSLAGLFGVDGILADCRFWPVEINPRYTASVEVLEYATGLCALSWHRRAFDPTAPQPLLPSNSVGFVGKAILFAPADLTFPENGPWLSELRNPTALHLAPDYADIPAPGEVIPRGRPILTFFVHKAKLGACEDALRERAEELTRLLFPHAPPPNAARPEAADARIASSEGRLPQNDPEHRDLH